MLIFIIIFISLNTHAQKKNSTKIDTQNIKTLLKKAQTGLKKDLSGSSVYTDIILKSIKDTTNKYYIQTQYIKGEIYYFENKKDSAILFFNKVLISPKKLKNDTNEVKALNFLGLCYLDLGQYDKAEKMIQKSIDKSIEYNLDYRKAAAYNNLSLIYDELGFYDKSIYSLSKSIKIFRKLNDTLSILKIFNNMGLLYEEMKDYKSAEDYFLKTLVLSNKINNMELKSSAYVNLGYLYTDLNKNAKALEYMKKAEPLLKLTENKGKIAENLIFTGNIYLNMKQYNEALSIYNQAYIIFQKIGSFKFLIKTINKIATIHILTNNFNIANKYIQEAKKILNNNPDKSLYSELYKTISFYFEKKKNFSNALVYYKKYSILKDSLMQTKFNENVAKQKVLFGNKAKQQKIDALNIENKAGKVIQEKQNEKIRIVTYLIIAAFIIILLAAFLILYIFKQLKIKNHLYDSINKSRKILLQKNNEITLQNEEIKSQTELLYQINDDLMQLKTAVDETDNAVVILDKEGNFEWGNKGFNKLYDINFEEFIKKYPNILDASKNSSNYVEMSRVIKNTIKNKTSGNYEFSTLNRTGKKIWIKTNIKAITDLKGNIQSIIVIDTDISDKVTTSRLLEIKNHELEKQKEEIDSSLRYAKTIQNAILPIAENMLTRNNYFIIYLPKDIVSGDFYWFSAKEDNPYIFYAVVDCTGHGVPGAFMSMIGIRLLNYLINEKNISLPSEILEQMNVSVKLALKQKLSGNRDGMDISLIRLKKIPNNKTEIIFSGAKQSVFIYSKKEDSITKIRGDIKTIGGFFYDDIPFTDKKITAEKNDIIYLFSDGIIDQDSSEGKKIGTSGFQNILKEITKFPLNEQKETLKKILNSYKKNTNQRDDITILGIKLE